MIALNGLDIPTGFAAAWAPGYRDKSWPARSQPVHGIVLHETAGPTAGSALNAWRNGYVGADFLIDLDGSILQCADPILHAPWHAGPWSPRHIGIEVVCPVTDRSPYSDTTAPRGAAWPEPWLGAPREQRGGVFAGVSKRLGKGVYVPPLAVQLDALCTLVAWLRDHVGTLCVRTIDPTAERLADTTPRAGIVAHAQVSTNRIDGYGPLRAVAEYDK